MSSSISPTNLKLHERTDTPSTFSTNVAFNITRLNDTLLKIAGLVDVNLTSLNDSNGLIWDAVASEWVNFAPFTTTTTTTTTTTSTTSTTHTTITGSTTTNTQSTTTTSSTSTSTSSTSSTTITTVESCALYEQMDTITTQRLIGHSTNYDRGGQAYYDPGANIGVCKVAFALTKYAGDISGKTYTVEIWTTTGTGSSIALDTLQGTSDGVTGNNAWNETWVDFNFSTPVSLINGTRYAIIVGTDSAADASNYITYYYAASDTLEGFGATFTTAGARYWWSGGTSDATIKIYSE